jgi:hypothetical protein
MSPPNTWAHHHGRFGAESRPPSLRRAIADALLTDRTATDTDEADQMAKERVAAYEQARAERRATRLRAAQGRLYELTQEEESTR